LQPTPTGDAPVLGTGHRDWLRQVGEFLQMPATETPAAPSGGPAPWPKTVSNGSDSRLPAVPGYEVLEVLGRGGMGVVYKARDLGLPRCVALKMIKAGVDISPEQLDRFRAEADAVARLNHPHVVQIYAQGTWQPPGGGEPLPYFAMEFVAGGSLDRRLRRGLPSPREAAHLVEVLARTLHALHEQGIVHRDLKPGNVLLAAPVEGSSGTTALGWPKVSDFGLVKCLGNAEGRTAEGQILGTPGYFAPEQVAGRKDVGPAADTWALGVILYECLTGKAPFRADTLLETFQRVAEAEPEPPSRINPNVSAELEAICLRCLRKHPAERYPSAAALANDLHRWLQGAALASPQPPTVAWAGAPERSSHSRRRFLLAAGGTAGALGLLTLGGWRWLFSGGRAQDGEARKDPESDGIGPDDKPVGPPFKGYIDITMERPGDQLRRGLWLNDPAARPLRKGDRVRIHTELNRPAYQYVLWIDTAGKVTAIYPWIDGDWDKRRPQRPRARLSLPEEKLDELFEIDPGTPGMETLLLLVRETPLPRDVDLAKILAGLEPQQRKRDEELAEVAWFENGEVVRDEKDRGPNLVDTVKSSNPILRLHHELHERLGKHFTYTRAVTFGNRGG
jgi:hypothetical protein